MEDDPSSPRMVFCDSHDEAGNDILGIGVGSEVDSFRECTLSTPATSKYMSVKRF